MARSHYSDKEDRVRRIRQMKAELDQKHGPMVYETSKGSLTSEDPMHTNRTFASESSARSHRASISDGSLVSKYSSPSNKSVVSNGTVSSLFVNSIKGWSDDTIEKWNDESIMFDTSTPPRIDPSTTRTTQQPRFTKDFLRKSIIDPTNTSVEYGRSAIRSPTSTGQPSLARKSSSKVPQMATAPTFSKPQGSRFASRLPNMGMKAELPKCFTDPDKGIAAETLTFSTKQDNFITTKDLTFSMEQDKRITAEVPIPSMEGDILRRLAILEGDMEERARRDSALGDSETSAKKTPDTRKPISYTPIEDDSTLRPSQQPALQADKLSKYHEQKLRQFNKKVTGYTAELHSLAAHSRKHYRQEVLEKIQYYQAKANEQADLIYALHDMKIALQL